jgi:hypothetical protein
MNSSRSIDAPRSFANRRTQKPKRWSHQDDLDRACADRRMITLYDLHNAKRYVGRLVSADAFTIKIEKMPGDLDSDEGVFFKHAIRSFKVM